MSYPAKAFSGDAGLDLYARTACDIAPRGGRVAVPTGIALAIRAGDVGLVVPRSGLAIKHGVTVLNSPGVIDSGFRGEVQVILVNLDAEREYRVERGDRIAQLLIVPLSSGELVLSNGLSDSDRGTGGLGHTGR